MNVTAAAIVAALVGLNAVTILASVVKRQHRTVDKLTDALADLNDDAIELNRRNEWQAGEILRLRALQPTQVIPQQPSTTTSPRYDRSAT